MRVKVGNSWYSAIRGQPIAIELTDEDKATIAAMPPDDKRYAVIDEDDARQTPPDIMREWLAD